MEVRDANAEKNTNVQDGKVEKSAEKHTAERDADADVDKVVAADSADLKKNTEEGVVEEDGEEEGEGDLEQALNELDEDLEQAFGRAADSIWGFASSVGSAVRSQPGLDAIRKNVSNRLPPLSDIGTQIGSLAPKEDSLASITGTITGSITSVAKTVQRNAVAVEAALLSKANSIGSETTNEIVSADKSVNTSESKESSDSKPSLPLLNEGVEGLANVGKKIQDSVVGQTVGGIWDGLWGDDEYDDDEEGDDALDGAPRTRFEERLYELAANPDTYCKPTSDKEAFDAWGKDFQLDDVAKQCVSILHKHEGIAELYVKVVPSMVEENEFWMRYFFAKHILEKEEERRRKLIEQADTTVEGENGDEDGGWGDDDWDDVVDESDDKVIKKSSSAKSGGKLGVSDSKEETTKEATKEATKETKDAPSSASAEKPAAGEEGKGKEPKEKAEAEAEAKGAGSTVERKDSDDVWSDDGDWE